MTSWKRTTCGGKSPASAKLALIHHLAKSSDHKLSDEHAWIVACDTDLKCCMMDDDEIDETTVDEKKVDEKKVKVEVVKKKVKVEVDTKKLNSRKSTRQSRVR